MMMFLFPEKRRFFSQRCPREARSLVEEISQESSSTQRYWPSYMLAQSTVLHVYHEPHLLYISFITEEEICLNMFRLRGSGYR